eukprot:scaffold32_cov190-Alexandrium_tamarense.AAC.30
MSLRLLLEASNQLCEKDETGKEMVQYLERKQCFSLLNTNGSPTGQWHSFGILTTATHTSGEIRGSPSIQSGLTS